MDIKRRNRQNIRKGLVILSFILMPITFKYFSPYIPIMSMSLGIINGSIIIFIFLFITALVFGRAWCAWVCPGGGIEEICSIINNKPSRGGKLNMIKWGIWGIWLAVIVSFFYSAGGYKSINLFFNIKNGVSLLNTFDYIIYYIVILIFILLPIVFGKRAACHYICWIAPFMIIGKYIGRVFKIPRLHLSVSNKGCLNCKVCNKVCAMDIDVNTMVQKNKMENAECIFCAECADACPEGIIQLSFKK